MNSKKVNRTFLAAVLIHLGVIAFLYFCSSFYSIGMVANYIVSELIVVLPAGAALLLSKEKVISFLRFRKVKISTVLMTILFTMLISPTISFVNVISQFFVENTAAAMSGSMITQPFGITFFFVAIYAPICEEVVCRGLLLNGYRKSGSVLSAIILSAVLFALLHMNFNQAAYAFVVGILLGLLMEATGSIWPGIIVHFLINGYQVSLLYFIKWISPQSMQAAQQVEMTTTVMLGMVVVMLVLTAITLPIAIVILVWMAGNEGRSQNLSAVFKKTAIKKDKTITCSLIIAIILCLAYMIAVCFI